MNRKQSEIRAIVEECLDEANIEHEYKFTGSGHQQVRFEMQGRRYAYTFPSTASDKRAAKNTRSGIRRLIASVARATLPAGPPRRSLLDARRVLPS